MICSTCTGSLSSERKFFKELTDEYGNKEIFYYTEISINGTSFPVVGSEFILRDLEGKVELETYLRSESHPETKKMITFFYVVLCKEAGPESKDSNLIKISGTVGREPMFRVLDNSGLEVLRFRVRYRSYDKKRTTVHCSAESLNARKLSTIKEDDSITLEGLVTLTYSRNIEIKVVRVLEHSKGGE